VIPELLSLCVCQCGDCIFAGEIRALSFPLTLLIGARCSIETFQGREKSMKRLSFGTSCAADSGVYCHASLSFLCDLQNVLAVMRKLGLDSFKGISI
jgi:hypothetical protein